MPTTASLPAPSKPTDRISVARLIAGYGAIACALPYLALKVLWLGGSHIGVADPAVIDDSSMVALNVVTAMMDLVAIAIALAFTHAWGQRIPAWLVLTPTWVALGLLTRFVVAVPVTAIAGLQEARTLPQSGGPVHPWVYSLVYTEFVGMGIGLTVAFVLYARVRWESVFNSTTGGISRGATHHVQVPLANVAAFMAAVLGGLHLAWAFGITVGIPEELIASRTFASSVVNAVDGAAMTAAAVGVVMMVHRLRRQSAFWIPLALSWVGSGFLFAWGLWGLVNVLGNTALVRARPNATAWLNLLGLVQLVSGLVIGLITVLLLAEREATHHDRMRRHEHV